AVLGAAPGRGRRIECNAIGSLLNPAEREALRFEQRGGMLRNVLTRPVPRLAAEHAEQVLDRMLTAASLERSDIAQWVWHAGGLALACAAPPRALVELGAGDGTLALRLARRLAPRWPGTRLTLLDLEPSVAPATADAIRACGWTLDVVAADALEWLASTRAARADVVLANLFGHHFAGERLDRLLGGVASAADAFVCVEPRRARLALVGSHLLGLIGCNDVTRHDAVVSVHAGFRDREIGTAWRVANASGWTLHEAAAGPFSHFFVARRGE